VDLKASGAIVLEEASITVNARRTVATELTVSVNHAVIGTEATGTGTENVRIDLTATVTVRDEVTVTASARTVVVVVLTVNEIVRVGNGNGSGKENGPQAGPRPAVVRPTAEEVFSIARDANTIFSHMRCRQWSR